MPNERLSDDEVVFRRIPPGSQWFEPPDRISSFNFKLKPAELGLSVYRKAVLSSQELLAKPEAIAGSVVASASVAAIRALTNVQGESLNLDVVICDDENNPGHAEIRGPEAGKLSASASKALKKLFQIEKTQ
jgi:hypothetical protein